MRVSGHGLLEIAAALTGRHLTPREATYTQFLARNGDILDQGIALFFVAPHSYTGEDVLEFQGHGGPAVLQSILLRCVELGARLAGPGEFTQRAFLNDKIDLLQAEGVADLIEATTQEAARSAVRSLQGDFSAAINVVLANLIDVRMLVESNLDFPEEEGVGALDKINLTDRLTEIQTEIRRVEAMSKQGMILREGAQVVLAGAPNVGKSSLLNKLAGEEIALVSDVPGTTRDSIRQELHINGVPLHIIDTAGLRDTDDTVELMGIARTRQNIDRADLVLLLSDSTNLMDKEIESEIRSRLPLSTSRLFVHNKIDITGESAREEMQDGAAHIYVSAKTGAGIELLQQKILTMIGWHNETGIFMARARHLEALDRASTHMSSAAQNTCALELLAEELRLAQKALSQITGEFVADDLLGEIFGRFCIGK